MSPSKGKVPDSQSNSRSIPGLRKMPFCDSKKTITNVTDSLEKQHMGGIKNFIPSKRGARNYRELGG